MTTTDFDVLRVLIAEGEHLQQDFKEKITSAQKIAKTIAAFANSKGGKILIGVKDTGGIRGVNIHEEKFMIDEAIAKYVYPKPEVVYRVFDGGKKQILMATIPEGTQKPYYSLVKTDDITPKNWAFVRVHDQVLPASPVLINVLKRQTAGKNTLIKYTDFERNILVFLENNAHITLKKMAEINNIPLWKAAQIASNLVCAGVVSIAPTATDDVFALVVV